MGLQSTYCPKGQIPEIRTWPAEMATSPTSRRMWGTHPGGLRHQQNWQRGFMDVQGFSWPQSCRSMLANLVGTPPSPQPESQGTLQKLVLQNRPPGGTYSLATQCCHRHGSRRRGCRAPGWDRQPAPGRGQPAAPLCWGWTLTYRTQNTGPESPVSSSLDAVKRHHK